MDGRLNQYRTTTTLGKTQLDLILQVYDGAIAAFRSAADSYRAEKLQAGYEQLERARKFLVHLYTTLDHEQGGDVADNLARLYTYVISQIDSAQATKDLTLIESNIKILDNLRDGWKQLKAHETKEKQSQNDDPPRGGNLRVSG